MKAIIFGVANERSLAWAIAQNLHQQSFELAFTYGSPNLERRVMPLAESVGSKIVLPCDVYKNEEMDAVTAKISETWGTLDCLVHSVAMADRTDLEGRFVDTSLAGFQLAMNISVYSLLALTKRFEPMLEKSGNGSVLTLSYYGAQKVVPNYNVMGVAKAALESSVRYLAYDLGPKKIRVNAISAGPVKTLAASGIRDFRAQLEGAGQRTPLRENIDGADVGALAGFLASPAARHITGSTMYVDSGANIMGSF
ncbi:MAG: enoyl-ACP reductase [Xanthomonadaceae bacterium]|nr:enoyl-ACP reductase [Xanthomonadaceae bacterium]